METTTDAASNVASASQLPVKATNRLCMMGLNAGVMALSVNILATIAPCLFGNLPVFRNLGAVTLPVISGFEITVAGAAIGIFLVGLCRVIRSRCVESGIGAACGGIALSLAAICVPCLPWLGLFVGAACARSGD